MDLELAKAAVAVEAGADAVMDLSTDGDLRSIRRRVLRAVPLPVGTVPVYEAAAGALRSRGAAVAMTVDDLFGAIRSHCEDGVDFFTVHCGITRETLRLLRRRRRVIPMVSRGGALIAGWMLYHDKENPLYEYFDRLLEVAREYDVTLSLGDGLRPGCIADATDTLQVDELVALGELVLRAREAGVQVMVEGPGHLPLDQIEANVVLAKRLTHGAPLYLLGPLVTDISPGYDHISAAIGRAIAAARGADFLCYVTPSEHLGLPAPQDVRAGVVAARIAAHAADLARGRPDAVRRDLAMARARNALDWERQIALAVDPAAARSRSGAISRDSPCTMCGEYCAMKLVNGFLELADREGPAGPGCVPPDHR